MQYVMLIGGDPADNAKLSESEQQAVYEKIGAWWGDLAQKGKILGGHELQDVSTATTIRLRNGDTLVTDGPFVETKEVIGGYGVLECADLDEAISIAKTWPAPYATLEVRPVVDHSGN